MIDLTLLTIGSRYTRTYLAAAWGYKSWEAIGKGVVTPRGTNLILLFITAEKEADAEQYEDRIDGDLLYWDGEKEHRSDQRIATAEARGDAIHVFYRETHDARFEYRGRCTLLHWERRDDPPSKFVFRLLNSLSATSDVRRSTTELATVTQTEREALVRARIGQGEFRTALITRWQGCAVSGSQVLDILRASHIKPWRLSTNAERLDPSNGLLLLPNYDALFDRGMISFDDAGKILIAKSLRAADAEKLGVSRADHLRALPPGIGPYMEFHREHVFSGETRPKRLSTRSPQ